MTHTALRRFWRILAAASLSLFVALPALSAAEVYSFSVAPQFERRMLFSIWQPVVDALEKQTGLRFQLVTSLSVNSYEDEVLKSQYDFIYINPYMMPTAARHAGYLPLVRDEKPLRGILVVRADSPLRQVAELNGKTLAVPSISALGASLLLRAELERSHNVRLQPVVAKTHGSVFLHVINGLADAGGSVQKALSEQEPRIRDNLRVLHETRGVPSHPVAAHKRVPPAVREQVRQAFIELSATPAGRELLAKIPMQNAVVTSDADYAVLATLKLENYLDAP